MYYLGKKKMASKNISIKDVTYNKLLAIKQQNESFTEIIERLLKKNRATVEKLHDFFGIWKNDPLLTQEEFELNRKELNAQIIRNLD
jgi:predicted CopG family antitoxin